MNDHAMVATGASGTTLLDLTFPARADRLKEVRQAVRDALAEVGCDEELVGDIVIAIDEACQNIIRHAYGGDCDEPIELELRAGAGELVARLRDHAPTVDIADIAPRDLDDIRPGGLGTHFIREIMDSVDYAAAASDRGNLLTMRRRIG